jgi:hypothetical protein
MALVDVAETMCFYDETRLTLICGSVAERSGAVWRGSLFDSQADRRGCIWSVIARIS